MMISAARRLTPRAATLLLLLWVAAAPCAPGEAVPSPGTFPAQHPVLGIERKGTTAFHCLHWEVFFVALYAPASCKSRAEALDEATTKSLVIHYNWYVDRSDMEPRFRKALKRCTGEAPVLSGAETDWLAATFSDAVRGDSYEFRYLPGAPPQIHRNGAPAAVAGDARLATAFFAVWLSPRGIDKRMARELFPGT